MAETLGSLCDKLTIVKLKQWHTENAERKASLESQEMQLTAEIDGFVSAALQGNIPIERLTFASNKVYDPSRVRVEGVTGTIGQVVAQLAAVNCELWHEQEKVYNFDSISDEDKSRLVGRLSSLNLTRNHCMDAIDNALLAAVSGRAGREPD